MSFIKDAVWKAFQKVGINVSLEKKPLPSVLLHHDIDVLFDVGANVGQYATRARRQGFSNEIISFEPLSAAYKDLAKSAALDPNWILHERCAIGAAKGSGSINVSKNSFSSSMLPMLSHHSEAAPDSVYVSTEQVNIVTLDSIFRDYCQPNQRAFLKIDTQGFERDVLDGAAESLQHIVGVELEMSIVPLYASQVLYDYFFEFMRTQGFLLWSIQPGFCDQRTGQLLQFDGVFIRP